VGVFIDQVQGQLTLADLGAQMRVLAGQK